MRIIYVPVYSLWLMIGPFICVIKSVNIGRIRLSLQMKERNLSRCIYHAYSATSVAFASHVEIETPNYIFLVF
jgi:hypothetical protein